ncbi:MAG TPA: YgiQ family radical SAM protein [Deltaproteobacteria bacterium]|nr:YgiQ family radical SAM protein [Deltaproteobacteria bacterium]
MSFLPVNRQQMHQRGWNELDVIFVTGDAYIDHPAFGVPLLARWLESHGFRTGIIAQPDWRTAEAFTVLGRPRLFFAVSAGAMDSMVAHYTPARKLRHDDAYTPGNRHGARPNRATIIYTSRLKESYRGVPVIIGGIEASLRRFSHYDYWEDKVRRSILFDSKADMLVYGMGEHPLLAVAERMRRGECLPDIRDVRGTAYAIDGQTDMCSGAECLEIPAHEATVTAPESFCDAFRLTIQEQNPYSARTILQRHGKRMLVCNPPAFPLNEAEMDAVYALPFQKSPHPSYCEQIPAWEQIKTSITSHRGCFGGCSFCAITMHQGKTIQSRSEASIMSEIDELADKPWFRGSISDIGGPTANMYGLYCSDDARRNTCKRQSCLYPQICGNLFTGDKRAVAMLRNARSRKSVKHIAVSSGIRYDLLERQPGYFMELIGHHVSGLLKIAPEHLVDSVTAVMCKPGKKPFEQFVKKFYTESERLGKRQHVVPYLISGHPGCRLADMLELALTLKQYGMKVEQVQDFTPTPGTLSTCMYHTGIEPFSGKRLHVAKSDREKGLQKALLLWHLPAERRKVLDALNELGRSDLAITFFAETGIKDHGRTQRKNGASLTRSPKSGHKKTR